MDLMIVFFGFLAVTVILLILSALNYFLGQPNVIVKTDDKPSTDLGSQSSQQATRRTSACQNRRKNARKKQREQLAASNDNSNSKKDPEEQSIELAANATDEQLPTTVEEAEEIDQFEDPIEFEQLVPCPVPPVTHIEDEQKPTISIKQRNKQKTPQINSKSSTNASIELPIPPKDESIVPSKPQASVAPVKQNSRSFYNKRSTKTLENQHYKSNGHGSPSSSPSSYQNYPSSGQNSLPPRFRQQKDPISSPQQKSDGKSKNCSISLDSAARQNEFVPSKRHTTAEHSSQHHDLSFNNDYSSESDIISESASASTSIHSNNHHAYLSTSADYQQKQHSFKEFDLLRSSASSRIPLDQLISIFDTKSFTTDELELLLNKVTSKHHSNKQDRQRLVSTARNEQLIERLIDENNRNQVKLLAIDLQTEKTRVLELTKVNTDMSQIMRQLQQQQQQQQQPSNELVQYQQTLVSYQMQLKRLSDENTQLVHQLNAYSMMPGSINELKQQQQILSEQIRQMNMKNSSLEKEISDGERASKHAAEIYKKADAQKQDRIEQMMTDLNKYKKIDTDLATLRQKHKDMEKIFQLKLDEMTDQRDELEEDCRKLKEKVENYEKLKIQYEQLQAKIQSDTNSSKSVDQFERELIEVKSKHDLLTQRNRKIMEQLNKLTQEQKSNKNLQSS